MPETIDARGLTCPVPSDLAFRALLSKKLPELVVLVDDPASKDHLRRIGDQLKYAVTVTPRGDHDEIRFHK